MPYQRSDKAQYFTCLIGEIIPHEEGYGNGERDEVVGAAYACVETEKKEWLPDLVITLTVRSA